MSRCLLDVNVLIALIDRDHVHHDSAQSWFGATGHAAWSTCPITQNGVIRIVGGSRYPGDMGPPARIVALLARFCALPGHEFWPDDISLLDPTRISSDRLLGQGQVTDSYLLALAVAHGGKLATFDRKLVTDAVPGGRRHIEVLGSEPRR